LEAAPTDACTDSIMVPAFDGVEVVSRPSRASRATVLLPTFLTPFETRQNIARSFSLCRIITVVSLTALAVVSSPFLHHEGFSVLATLHDVPGFDECLYYCYMTKADSSFAEKVGGEGLCEDGEGRSSIKFSVCSRSEKGEYQGCTLLVDNATVIDGEVMGRTRRCQFKVVKPMWKSLVTAVVFIFVIILIVQEMPGHILLPGGAGILCLLGILSRNEVFNGFSSSGVTALAVLFPISEAIQETGLLEKGVSILLGTPKTLRGALLSMMFPVALLSAFLSNTATVALMIPILCTWARRLDLHPGKLLMPLSFASQLGGSMTLLGSSTCIIAQTVVKDGYKMLPFDLARLGVPLMLVGTGVIASLAQTSLLSSSADTSSTDDDAEKDATEVYQVFFNVQALGGMDGNSIEDSGLQRIPGVHFVRNVQHMDVDARGGTRSAEVVGAEVLRAGDELEVLCTVEGIIALRAQAGISLKSQPNLTALGGRRRQRFLFEVAVADDSEFIRTDIVKDPRALRKEFGACFIAGPRAPISQASDPIAGATDVVLHCSRSDVCRADSHPAAAQICPGSVLLFEVNENWIEDKAHSRWQAACSLVQKVPDSSPLRVGGPVDNIRCISVVSGMVLLIGLASIPSSGVKLETGGLFFLLVLLCIRALTVEQLFAAIKFDILLIVAGALAMGEALQCTGIVNYLANTLMGLAEPFGVFGVLIVLYILAVFMSMFINNGATVAIIGPMIMSMAEKDQDLDLKVLTWTLTYAAGSCFMTPLGYQTNLMVMPDGKYTFFDFARFGVAVQATHMVFAVVFAAMYMKIFPN